MPALSATTAAFLQRIKDDLTIGSDLGSSVRGAAQNYLRAQDMATALELLMDALDTVALTTVSGTTSSVTDGAATFVASRQIGNVVTFTGNVTAALAGITAVVLANTTTTLTFEAASLPAAPAAGDTYSIDGGFLDAIISDLRSGQGLADAPSSNVFGNSRLIQDALLQLVNRLRVAADASVVLDTDGSDTITVTLDGTLAGSVGNDVSIEIVDPGAINQTLSSSFDAVTKVLTVSLDTDGSGDPDDTENTTTLVAAEIDGNTDFTSADTGTDSVTLAEIGRFFCTGGVSTDDHKRLVQAGTLLAGSTVSRVNLDNRGVDFIIDQLKGRVITVGSEEPRRIVSNDESTALVARVYGSAPGTDAYTINEPDQAEKPHPSADTHPGAQPGANDILAELLDKAEESLVAIVLPT